VDGVKIPLTIHQDTGQAEVVIKIREVKQNAAIDDAKFTKPAAALRRSGRMAQSVQIWSQTGAEPPAWR
jgi:hypothetical protein